MKKSLIRKTGKVLLILFSILLLLVLVVFLGIWGYQKYTDYRLGKVLAELPKDPTLSTEVVADLHSDETIGEDKMTIGEKMDKGLNPYVTDTSHDGISDWDEINKYHTDPHKFSTAGDGISDMAKIQEGLDPAKPVDPDEVEPFTIHDDALDVTLQTNDLNAKYHTFIEPYHQAELQDVYQPVREPVRFINYTGNVAISLPDDLEDPEALKAYYFDFEKKEFIKIAEQSYHTDDGLVAFIDRSYPVYILDPDTYQTISQYYYFRVSGFQFSRAAAGFDHKIYLFQRGPKDNEAFGREVYEHDTYGVIDFTAQQIGPISAFFLDRVFALLDRVFQPLDDADASMLARALLDYGTVIGTPDYAKRFAVPWLYETEETDDAEEPEDTENSPNVIDTGFQVNGHAFKFGNLRTVIGDGGVCAGMSRVTERLFNNQKIPKELDFEPSTWRGVLLDVVKADEEERNKLSYDLEPQMSHYPFFENGQLYPYHFTDDQIAYLTETEFVDTDLKIDPADLSEPDQTLIEFLETQWAYSNERKYAETVPYDSDNLDILDQVEDKLAEGKMVYVGFSRSSDGHSVSAYKMEYDAHNPDLIRLYVYDPNLPYELMQKFGKNEISIDIYKRKKKTLFGTKTFFEYDYTPFEKFRDQYSYSNVEASGELRFYYNDEPLTGK